MVQDKKKKEALQESPGGPVVRTWRSHCRGRGTKILEDAELGQIKKKKEEAALHFRSRS